MPEEELGFIDIGLALEKIRVSTFVEPTNCHIPFAALGIQHLWNIPKQCLINLDDADSIEKVVNWAIFEKLAESKRLRWPRKNSIGNLNHRKNVWVHGQTMKKVLIIYPHWPPSNLVGVHA